MATKRKKQTRQKPQPISLSISSAVDDAFNDAEELQTELRDWFDNLPENFQNADKGSAISEAADTLENVSKPEVPAGLVGDISYTPMTKRRQTRADRLSMCVVRVEAAKSVAEERAADLAQCTYDESGKLLGDQCVENAPETENERDELVTDLEAFAEECDNAISEWEGVSFPTMYG